MAGASKVNTGSGGTIAPTVRVRTAPHSNGYSSRTIIISAKRINRSDIPVNDQTKNVTVYYNSIPSNQFDMVLNPDNAEPVVQFYYTLKVRYEITPKETEKAMTALRTTLTPKNK